MHNNIDAKIEGHGAKSNNAFEVLYELVRDSEEKVSDKSKKWLRQHRVTKDTKYQQNQQDSKK